MKFTNTYPLFFFLLFACNQSPPPREVQPCEDLATLGLDDIGQETLKAMLEISRAKIAAAGKVGAAHYVKDFDGDNLENEAETELGTDPYWPDTDNDQLPDGYEVQIGEDPLKPNLELVKSFQAKMDTLLVQNGNMVFAGITNTSSCRLTGFNPTTCKGTCTGSCALGLVSCYWGWNAAQWAIDKLAGGPCPGWYCNCP